MTTLQLADAPATTHPIQTSILPPQQRCRLIQHSLKAGASFRRFGSDVPATLQAISGQGQVHSEGTQADLRPGTLCSLRAGQDCTLSASSDLVVLVSEYLTPSIPC